ncbi:MAG: Asp-tRNA(Asn)/Glu-tRNA(Gln) amidotransferase subunit GatC [Parachlamydia sp.]|nr:Asp-tRNA(Asn)/Glu-tRNA(Gln) amidotransferase subunit GatC [Parachlamydia sp.]
MAELDKKAIKSLTQLSRIDCTEEEQESLLQDLKKILHYVEQLNEIDTTHVPPCNQVLEDMVNVMREDAVGPTLSRDVFLANAPSHVGGMIRVPPVIKTS